MAPKPGNQTTRDLRRGPHPLEVHGGKWLAQKFLLPFAEEHFEEQCAGISD